MFNIASFLLFVCILILSNIISFYRGKYEGLMDASEEDRHERTYRLGNRDNNLREYGDSIS